MHREINKVQLEQKNKSFCKNNYLILYTNVLPIINQYRFQFVWNFNFYFNFCKKLFFLKIKQNRLDVKIGLTEKQSNLS